MAKIEINGAKYTPVARHLDELAEFAPHLVDPIKAWIEDGHFPGTWPTAVLENNLLHGLRYSDSHNSALLCPLVNWLQAWAPTDCQGSLDKVIKWAHAHRDSRKV